MHIPNTLDRHDQHRRPRPEALEERARLGPGSELGYGEDALFDVYGRARREGEELLGGVRRVCAEEC
jgi:hypothetical protein